MVGHLGIFSGTSQPGMSPQWRDSVLAQGDVFVRYPVHVALDPTRKFLLEERTHYSFPEWIGKQQKMN